ncbi:MAG: PSD1 and planctomycete cytochrome C domain-containing protein [Flavobacteriaceae bacterium]
MVPKSRFFFLLMYGLILLSACGPEMPGEVAVAYEKLPAKIDFNFHVRPILSDRCFQCHGPDDKARKADLRLDLEEGIFDQLQDKELFPVIPGDPDKSELIRRVLNEDLEIMMPTPESNLSLSETEKAILVKWVEQGAEWKSHWAFDVPVKVELPKVEEVTWPKNEIDYFVLKRLESLKLQPSPEAKKETLIRRLSFDLTGLPPTLEEVAYFVNNTSDNAYEELVDRLLATPAYAERWAWEWLDVSRYSDTNGFQGDFTRDAWPWRDWVINAFRENMPYDQFTIKQLAGDLLPDATTDDVLATAFNRNHTYNTEGGTIPEETRVSNVFDRTETTGTVWLGLTLNCVRCHDHKFDDIAQKEYYQLFHYFNQTSEEGGGWGGKQKPLLTLGSQDTVDMINRLETYIISLKDEVEKLEYDKFPRDLGLPASESKVAKNTKGLDPRILLKEAKLRGTGEFGQLLKYFRPTEDVYGRTIKKLHNVMLEYDRISAASIQVMTMDELEVPRPTHVLERGTYNKPLLEEVINPGVPKILPPLEAENNNRLALARWLVSEDQPLTSRVTVNRYWQSFFGNGLVKTVEDFGVQGSLPTHPQLLDWLARDFQENGWDLRHLFKKIVMSATYRQSSKVSEELLQIDPENALLARATRMRLPSWMLRDQALAISGLLVDSLGGEPVMPYQPDGVWSEATFGKIKYKQDRGDALYRKTLYTFWRRIVGPTFLFDNASRQVCTVKSSNTNTPLHALTTLNDVTYMEAARVIGERMLTHTSNDEERIKYGFRLATSRAPDSSELEILQNQLKQLRQLYRSSPEEALKVTSIGDFRKNSTLELADHASYSVLGSLLLNLDETITRQ